MGKKPHHVPSVGEVVIAEALEAHLDPAHPDSASSRGLPADPWESDWSRVLTSTLPEVIAAERSSIVTSLKTFWPNDWVSPGGGASTIAGDPGPSISRAGTP